MAIDYSNMPNGVRKLPKDLNEELLGSMEKLNQTMERVGIDLKNSDRQSKKELKESNDILKEFEKFIKKNGNLSEDLSESTRDFAREFTKEWSHTYGKNINENTQKELNSIARNLLKLQKDAKEVYGKGFQSTSKYREELNALRIESISKLKSAKKEDEKKSKENSTLSKKYAKESETEKTLEDIKEKMDSLTDEAFTKYGANFEQNEDYIKEMSALLKQSRQDYFESYLSDENKLYENSRISDNKYREDTHKEETNRSIIQNIQKLNQEAFLKYGANFEQNEDYQKNYRALIKKASDDRKKAKKEDWDARDDLFHDSVEKIKEVIFDQKKSLMGFLGPLNLVLSPIQEFFGGDLIRYLFGKIKKAVSTKVTEKQVAKLKDGEGFLYLGNKLDQLSLPNNNTNSMNLLPSPLSEDTMRSWDKKSKKKPTYNDLMKLGGLGAIGLYLGDILQNKDEKNKDKKGSFDKLNLDDIFGGGDIVKNAKILLNGKALSGAALVAGLVWTVVDAFHGWLNAEDWGVSKVSGAIGGALAGNGEGLGNAAKNGIKWALTFGAVGGLAGGPVGILVGSLGGLVIGSILGYFGGEKVANEIQSVIDAFDIHSLSEGLKKVWDDSQKSYLEKAGLSFVEMFKWFGDSYSRYKGDRSKHDVEAIKNGTKAEEWDESSRNFQLQLAGIVGWENYASMFEKTSPFETGDKQQIRMLRTYIDNRDSITKKYADSWFGLDTSMLISAFKVLENVWGGDVGDRYFTWYNKDKSLDFVEGTLSLTKINNKDISETFGEDWKNLQRYKDYLLSMNHKSKNSIDFEKLKKKNSINKVEDAILQSNGSPQYLIRGNERIELDPQDNILATTNFIGESKDFKRGELNPIIDNISNKNNSLSKFGKSEFYKVEQEIKRQNATSNKINNVSNIINNNSSSMEKSNYKNQLRDIVELLSKILDESKNKIQMPSLTRNDLLQIAGGYF